MKIPHEAGADFTREISIVDATAAGRVLSATISSEVVVKRAFGAEVLSHAPDAIDRTRIDSLDGKLPLLMGHDANGLPIGFVSDFANNDGVLRGNLTFAEGDRPDEVLRLHRSGVPVGISVGYRVDWDEATYDQDSDQYTFARWEPREVSIVGVPADASAMLGRNYQGEIMPDKDKDETVVDFTTAFARGRDDGIGAGAALERKRLAEIDGIFAMGSVPKTPVLSAMRSTAIEEGWAPDVVRKSLLEAMGAVEEPAASGAPAEDATVRVEAGIDALDHVRSNAELVLLHRANVVRDEKTHIAISESGLAALSLVEMGREFLRVSNHPASRGNRDAVVDGAIMHRAAGHTTSDFTNLLTNVASKSLMRGWTEIPETWRSIARVGSLPDFKTAERPGLSHFPDLIEVPESGIMQSGTFTDYKESVSLVEYGRTMMLTRRTLLNDDLGAFTNIPRHMGRSASRLVGDQVYDTLYSASGVGPTLNQDSKAVFHADHGNYVTSGAAPSIATLNSGFTAMGTQTDPSGSAILNIEPKTLLVPRALSATARSLAAAEKDPSVASGESPNVFRGRFEVVEEARLEASSHGNNAAGWYLVADPNMFDVIEVAFLNGIDTPYLREEQEWSTRGVQWAVGIDCGVVFLDYRGLYYNDGA